MEKRMYGLVNYQLTGIQMGIQFLHGVVEYSRLISNLGLTDELERYNEWADNDKTVILLNGGTTNNRIVNGQYVGTLNQHKESLDKNGITNVSFSEIDLGDQMTSVVFIVDERVFNKKNYPDFEDWIIENYGDLLISNSGNYKSSYQAAKSMRLSKSEEDKKVYQIWVEFVGGEKNVFLRDFLKNFRLA